MKWNSIQCKRSGCENQDDENCMRGVCTLTMHQPCQQVEYVFFLLLPLLLLHFPPRHSYFISGFHRDGFLSFSFLSIYIILNRWSTFSIEKFIHTFYHPAHSPENGFRGALHNSSRERKREWRRWKKRKSIILCDIYVRVLATWFGLCSVCVWIWINVCTTYIMVYICVSYDWALLPLSMFERSCISTSISLTVEIERIFILSMFGVCMPFLLCSYFLDFSCSLSLAGCRARSSSPIIISPQHSATSVLTICSCVLFIFFAIHIFLFRSFRRLPFAHTHISFSVRSLPHFIFFARSVRYPPIYTFNTHITHGTYTWNADCAICCCICF